MARVQADDPEQMTFLAGRQPFYVGEAIWLGGEIRLAVSAYLSSELPPRRFVSSARAIVLKGDQVLVQRSVEDVHILPGGRLEPGEGFESGLRREILEESGWRVEVVGVLGFQRLQHLTPKQPGYPYPYPDFFWAIYLARAVEHLPAGRLEDGYDLGAEFHPAEEARALGLKAAESAYLSAALAAAR